MTRKVAWWLPSFFSLVVGHFPFTVFFSYKAQQSIFPVFAMNLSFCFVEQGPKTRCFSPFPSVGRNNFVWRKPKTLTAESFLTSFHKSENSCYELQSSLFVQTLAMKSIILFSLFFLGWTQNEEKKVKNRK